MPALASWLQAQGPGAPPVFLSYFGSGEPDYYGIKATRLPFVNGFKIKPRGYEPTAGIYCISATMLQHIYSPVRGEWTLENEKKYQEARAKEPLFREYWRNPAENAARFRGDWYLTGDMARRDEQGYYWFVGRADDVIKSAGYRIGPFEVESALLMHPAVAEAAVVGVPDALRGHIVKAYVVLKAERAPYPGLEDELVDVVKTHVGRHQYPRAIELLGELPKTETGKIQRFLLRQRP